jgi:hypothetical protein
MKWIIRAVAAGLIGTCGSAEAKRVTLSCVSDPANTRYGDVDLFVVDTDQNTYAWGATGGSGSLSNDPSKVFNRGNGGNFGVNIVEDEGGITASHFAPGFVEGIVYSRGQLILGQTVSIRSVGLFNSSARFRCARFDQ